MGKSLLASDSLKIPAGITITSKTRKVIVKGPRGTLEQEFRHVPCDIAIQGEEVTVQAWNARRKRVAAVNSVTSHIRNMIIGVTKGYLYKMRSVYAHFPIALNVANDGSWIEIRNFLGERNVRKITMHDGVKVSKTENKDEIKLIGNDVTKVSLSAARIQQSTHVRNKDIRKFLDGVYVSERLNEKGDEDS